MKTRMRTIFLFLMAVSLFYGRDNVYGQQTQSTELPIYFRIGNSIIDPNYVDNQATLTKLSKILTQDNTRYIESLVISGYSSITAQEEETTVIHNTPLIAKPDRKSRLALKTNLLYGAYAFTPNLGVEIGIGRHTTLDISGGYNWFNLDGAKNNNKKRVHWLIQPEFRYFLKERFNGHFLGVHALYSQYNIGGHTMPMFFGKGSKDYRHEGWAAAAGVSYGYQLALGRSWNVEFNIGVGYAQLTYDKYDCTNCGKKVSNETKHYFGPTKAGISFIWMIK